jgi:hypothetical protein
LKHILSALALAIAIGAAAAPARAADVQDFTIHNVTGMTFTELYVEPMSNTDNWGEDLLKGDQMGEGETKINFKGNSDECKYGIKVVTADGKSWEVNDIDLCSVSNFALGVENGKVVYAHD